MATLYDERPEDVDNEEEEVSQVTEEPEQETPQEDDIPDK
jgi:hypothetical protein